MTPLIDADILLYEIGFAKQRKTETGEIIPDPVEEVNDAIDNKIAEICASVFATEPPMLFLSGKNNFRYEIAKARDYKGDRKKIKPFHYAYIKAYLQAKWNAIIIDGMEADDALCIEQTSRLKFKDTIICSRDKDLRMCQGFHYGWECGKQGSFGPAWVNEMGEIKLKGPKKIVGTGLKFFYSQILTGDSTDTYDGLKGCGPIRAFKLLNPCDTEAELFKTVLGAYREKHCEEAEERLLEQGRLAWMVRELHEDGSPKIWSFPNV